MSCNREKLKKYSIKIMNSDRFFINQAGELLYCKRDKIAICCFYKHKCIESPLEKKNIAVVAQKGFLKNQVGFSLFTIILLSPTKFAKNIKYMRLR